MKEKRKFIQVISGPRQVGKTTLVGQLLEKLDIPSQYISADDAGPEGAIWIEKHWEASRRILMTEGAGAPAPPVRNGSQAFRNGTLL